MNHECYKYKIFIIILGKDRYVRQVGISNMGDLLLGPTGSSCELSYFWILVFEYQRVDSFRIKVNFAIDFEVSFDGRAKARRILVFALGIESSEESRLRGAILD